MNGRILIVDDDPEVLALYRAVLTGAGFEADAAQSGREAIDRIGQHDYAVVLIDRMMPTISGMEVLAALRTQTPMTIPVIVTSDNTVQAAVESMRAGAWDFLAKPVDPLDLTRVVRHALDHHRTRHEQSLEQATSVVFGTLDAADLPYAIAELAVDVLQADHAVLLTTGIDSESFETLYRASARDKEPPDLKKEIWAAFAGRVRHDLAPLVLPTDAARTGIPGADRLSALLYPMVARNHLLGVLGVWREPNRPHYGRADLWRAGILASHAALALDNAHLVAHLRERVDALARARRTLTTNERLEGIGQLATGLAHELHAPASALQTHLRAASQHVSDLPDTDERRELLARLAYADEAANRIAAVAGDLSRLSRSREDVEFEVSQVVASALRMAGGRLHEEVDVDIAHVRVQGNPGQIAQALQHLLVNADRAVRDVEEPHIAVQAHREGGNVVIRVHDNGCGIAEHDLDLVLEPFVTLWPESTAPGLGLSTTFEIVERHGGNLRLSSRIGEGSVAEVRLPALDDEGTFALTED